MRPIFFALICLFGVGCGKKQESSAPTSASSPSGQAAPATNTSSASTPAAPADNSAALLAELTQVVRKYGVEKQRVPKNLEELVSAGYLPALPEAPAGKKFAINKNLAVVLENR